MPIRTYSQALNEAMHMEMSRDESIVLYGEDTITGGYFQVGKGLYERFGAARVFDTPIAEAAIAGAAVGMAITGLRPIVDLQFADFFAIAMDEISNKAGKWRYMHGGNFTVPIVYRMAVGMIGGAGAEHSQSPEAHFMHCPGLKVVMPSTPYDAKGLLISAIRDDNPVCFLEPKSLYFSKGEVPEEAYAIPLGCANVRRAGADITAISWGTMVNTVLAAADELARAKIDLEVIDLRCLAPLDMNTVLNSVRKTGRALIVHEAPKTGGAGAEIAARIAEHSLYDLKAPIRRIAGEDVPVPQNAELEQFIVPNPSLIVAATREMMADA